MNFPELYAIANVDSLRDPSAYVKALLEAGVKIIQLRSKTADRQRLLELCRSSVELAKTQSKGAKIIVNDFPGLCAESGADGVHLGQEDSVVEEARKALGPDAIIGLSTHTLEQAQAAPKSQLSYLAFGPVFRSPSKQGHAPETGVPKLAEAVQIASPLPLVAIGGITSENAAEVYRSGAASVAVISDLARAENIQEKAFSFSAAHRGNHRRRSGG